MDLFLLALMKMTGYVIDILALLKYDFPRLVTQIFF